MFSAIIHVLVHVYMGARWLVAPVYQCIVKEREMFSSHCLYSLRHCISLAGESVKQGLVAPTYQCIMKGSEMFSTPLPIFIATLHYFSWRERKGNICVFQIANSKEKIAHHYTVKDLYITYAIFPSLRFSLP
jgi:hypothetical protein